jgi:hypothetical protein
MKPQLDGKSLTECFDLVLRCGSEIESLCESLSQMFLKSLAAPSNALPCALASAREEDAREDPSGWIYTDTSRSFALKSKGKGRKKSDAYFVFQISMHGDGIPSCVAEPILHVGCWTEPVDFEDECFIHFPGDPGELPELVEQRLLRWSEDGETAWNACEWTFSIRLMCVNSSEDLKSLVIDPTLKLLRLGSSSKSVLEALPDDLFETGLVRYASSEDLL